MHRSLRILPLKNCIPLENNDYENRNHEKDFYNHLNSVELKNQEVVRNLHTHRCYLSFFHSFFMLQRTNLEYRLYDIKNANIFSITDYRGDNPVPLFLSAISIARHYERLAWK